MSVVIFDVHYRDGYYSFAGNSLWFENSSGDPLSSLNMINNVTSVQLMEDSKDIFNVNYTVLKSEESAYFASVDGSHLAENWARAINANNVNDQVDNSIMNAEMTIASSQLTASERYVKTIVDFHDMLMSLANPFIRRKYWKLLSSLNEQAYLHFWELIEDYRLRLSDKSLKHNEKEILHRASAIYNSFLSNSSPCFLARLSSSSRSDIQMKLRDGRADGNLFVGVQKETMLFLSQMFFDNFIPKHKSFIQRMEIYLSFIDVSNLMRSKFFLHCLIYSIFRRMIQSSIYRILRLVQIAQPLLLHRQRLDFGILFLFLHV